MPFPVPPLPTRLPPPRSPSPSSPSSLPLPSHRRRSPAMRASKAGALDGVKPQRANLYVVHEDVSLSHCFVADPRPVGDGVYDAPVRYPAEDFTPEEQSLLAPHFTNLDRPVFALVNLPETVKGALFARYSRYSGTVRRLYLEEFASDAEAGARPFDGVEGERAAGLYERVFVGYGDDSIAQVGGAHVACEFVSNILTKLLQRGRLAAYLEQSTRYIPYDVPLPHDAGYRYYRDEQLGPEFGAAMDELFGIYSRSLVQVEK